MTETVLQFFARMHRTEIRKGIASVLRRSQGRGPFPVTFSGGLGPRAPFTFLSQWPSPNHNARSAPDLAENVQLRFVLSLLLEISKICGSCSYKIGLMKKKGFVLMCFVLNLKSSP